MLNSSQHFYASPDSLDRTVVECARTMSFFGREDGYQGGGERINGYGVGEQDEMALGMAFSRDTSELLDSTGIIVTSKRECENEDDYVDVNGQYLCIKTERDDGDHHSVIPNNVDHAQIFEMKHLDDVEQDVSNQELLVVWDGKRACAAHNSESIWLRKEPQCEVWSCKMSATYGHSTGPSRCAAHREVWMVLFENCVVAGCLKFGVVFSSEDPGVRCEAHAGEDRYRRSGLRQSRPLEHLVHDNGIGPRGLGLGLRLGDDDSAAAEVSAVFKQSQSEIIEQNLIGTRGESSGHSGLFQGIRGEAVSTSGPSPPNDYLQRVKLDNGFESNLVGAEIYRLKEEYEDLRQRMSKIEIELARLQGIQSRCPPQTNELISRRTTQGRSCPSAKSTIAAGNGGPCSSSAEMGKVSLDGYKWRKYGEMTLSGHGGVHYPKIFYGCSNIGCIARKTEERTDPGHIKHCYEGVHNHPQPGKAFPHSTSIPNWKRRKRHHNSCTD